MLSAVVHMDEKTPHLHVAYIPEVDGVDCKKNPCKRVNCSEFWKGFNSYGILQDKFYAHITSRGYELERGEVGSRAEHVCPSYISLGCCFEATTLLISIIIFIDIVKSNICACFYINVYA